MHRTLHVALFLGTAALAACSLLIGEDSLQCSTNADCEAKGGAFAATSCVNHVCVSEGAGDGASDASQMSEAGQADVAVSDASADSSYDAAGDGAVGPWSCVGKVSSPPEDMSRSVTLQYTVTDIGQNPLPGMTVQVCGRNDPGCINPLVSPMTTGVTGTVSLSVPYGAGVIVVVTGPPCADAGGSTCYLKTLYYVDPPPTVSATTATMIEALTPASVNALAGIGGHFFDPSEGILVLQLEDCSFTPGGAVPGVRFSLSSAAGMDAYAPDTASFYLLSSMNPDFTATQTTSASVGGYINAPPGLTIVTGTLVQGNLQIGQNEVVVGPSVVTYETIDPYEN
jgi:hypothetical protein